MRASEDQYQILLFVLSYLVYACSLLPGLSTLEE